MPKLYLCAIIKCGVLALLLSSTGCNSLLESPKYRFTEGIYDAKISKSAPIKVYIDMEKEKLVLYPAEDYRRGQIVRLDTTTKLVLAVPDERDISPGRAYIFSTPLLDLDVLTIPFKYRPGTAGIPQQLNTTFQGALFLGIRHDFYLYRYKFTPVGNYRKFFNHFSYSVGLFSGIGAATVNEALTGGRINYEYEGVIFLNGVTASVGVNNFTLGLALGLDRLLDKYRHDWVYQHKPWLGLAFGINLN